MKPRKQNPTIEEFINPTLVNIINLAHPLVKLSDSIDWQSIEDIFIDIYDKRSGRPAKDIRLMVGLHYLKYIYDLSDVAVLERWLENPYWQYFTGEKIFQSNMPINPSSMTKFRKRLKEQDLEELLSETIKLGFSQGYLKEEDALSVAVDTTVQEKAIKYPTDVQLYYDFIVLLNRYKDERGIKLNNSYIKSGKSLLRRYSGYIHAKQYKRASKVSQKLRTKTFKLYRAIKRELSSEDISSLEFCRLSNFYEKLLERKKDSKNKLYSFWAPEVECISKGKIHKRYEFGVKTGIVCSLNNGFIFDCSVFSGNPYDGHTLDANLKSAEARLSLFCKIKEAFVDLGYRKHNYDGEVEVVVVPKSLKKYSKEKRDKMKRRSVVEAVISRMKRMCRLNKNRLHGRQGDLVNAMFSSIAHNLRLLIAFFYFFIFEVKFSSFFALILDFFSFIEQNYKNTCQNNKGSLLLVNT